LSSEAFARFEFGGEDAQDADGQTRATKTISAEVYMCIAYREKNYYQDMKVIEVGVRSQWTHQKSGAVYESSALSLQLCQDVGGVSDVLVTLDVSVHDAIVGDSAPTIMSSRPSASATLRTIIETEGKMVTHRPGA